MENPFDTFEHSCMSAAMEEAIKAGERDEVPIGAVIACPRRQKIISVAGNRTRELHDPTAHAEILALRAACQILEAQRIPELDLYVTLEPCAMCAGAISFARIRRLIFAAPDEKGGGVLHGGQFFTQKTCHHRPETFSGLMAEEAASLLRNFFRARR